MRLHKRECSEPAFIDDVFSRADDLYLAMHDTEFPYLIPVNFARTGNQIYIHCASEGHKLDLLARNDRVAFSLAVDVEVDKPKFTTYYKSICGTGRAVMITDVDEKRRALECIGARYEALCARPSPDSDVHRVSVIRIDIVSMTGKRNLPR